MAYPGDHAALEYITVHSIVLKCNLTSKELVGVQEL